MMMMVMKVTEHSTDLLVDPELLQLLHYGIESEQVLSAPGVGVSIRVGPGNRSADHTPRERAWNAGDGQPLPLQLVHQDVIHCTQMETHTHTHVTHSLL